MRSITTVCIVLALLALAMPLRAQPRKSDDFRRYPDPIYDYPSPLLREMRTRELRRPLGEHGPYQPRANATAQNGTNGTEPNATNGSLGTFP